MDFNNDFIGWHFNELSPSKTMERLEDAFLNIVSG
jgi:hypothetical protein